MSDSNSPSSPLEQRRAAWRRWQMASVLPPPSTSPAATKDAVSAEPSPVEPTPPPEPPTELLAQWRASAEQAGRSAGHSAGKAEGYAQGLAQGKTEGHEQGYAEGHAQGMAAARAQVQAEAAQLHDIAQHCAQAVGALEEQIGQSLIQLALALAQQIVRSQLEINPMLIVPLVQEILRTDIGTERVRIWLHPDDLQLVQQHLHTELQDSACRLLADAALPRGGCRAQTAYGDIDATLQTRWRQLASALGQTLTSDTLAA